MYLSHAGSLLNTATTINGSNDGTDPVLPGKYMSLTVPSITSIQNQKIIRQQQTQTLILLATSFFIINSHSDSVLCSFFTLHQKIQRNSSFTPPNDQQSARLPSPERPLKHPPAVRTVFRGGVTISQLRHHQRTRALILSTTVLSSQGRRFLPRSRHQRWLAGHSSQRRIWHLQCSKRQVEALGRRSRAPVPRLPTSPPKAMILFLRRSEL